MKNFNIADKTMLIGFVAFMVLSALQIMNPENIWLEWALFISEAVLVGSIADWFAVTALFEKPLGFPFHTAILPKSRDSFIEKCSGMIKHEILPTKEVYNKIESADVPAKIIDLLLEHKDKVKKSLVETLVDKAKNLDDVFIEEKSYSFAQEAVKKLHDYSMKAEALDLIDNMVQNRRDAQWLNGRLKDLLKYFPEENGYHRTELELEQSKQVEKYIRSFIKDYVGEAKQDSVISGLLVKIASVSNVLNEDELTEVIVKHLHDMLKEAATENSRLNNQILEILHDLFETIGQDEETAKLLNNLRDNIADADFLQKVISNVLKNVRDHFTSNDLEKNKMRLLVEDIIDREIDECTDKLKKDSEFKSKVDDFLEDVVQHGALGARELLAQTVKAALSKMSADELNELVAGKIGDDLIHIRMNGAIVGGFLGAILFWPIKLFF